MEEFSWKDQLPPLHILLDWGNQDFLFISELLGRIKNVSITQDEESSFLKVKGLWIELISRIPLWAVELNKPTILRARRNHNSEIFKEEHEISYNEKNKHLIKYWGRFNKPYEPVFYGSIKNDSTNHSTIACLLETEKAISDDNCNTDVFDFTIGKWLIKEPLDEPVFLISLCLDEIHQAHNPNTTNGLSDLLQGVFEIGGNGLQALIKESWQLLTYYSCIRDETEKNYIISTALFWAIKEYYNGIGHEINGLFYPSSQTENQGLNIVMDKKSVDKTLSLKEVVMTRVKRKPSYNSYNVFDLCSSVAVSNNSFQFGTLNESRELLT